MKRLHVGKIQDQAESLGLSETIIYSNRFAILWDASLSETGASLLPVTEARLGFPVFH